MLINTWDILLLSVVTGMAVLTAYIENPIKKTFILMLPVPFTLAVLSLGKPIDATNVTALIVLTLYYHSVRILNNKLGLNIILSIIIGAVLYCFIGAGLARIIPPSSEAFWISCLLVLGTNITILFLTPVIEETGSKTTLSVYIKAPLTAVLVMGIIVLKQYLSGFMTLFPMVGVFATFETRKSLWTTCRSASALGITMTVMMMIIRICQDIMPKGMALMFGWIGMLFFLIPYFKIKTKPRRVR